MLKLITNKISYILRKLKIKLHFKMKPKVSHNSLSQVDEFSELVDSDATSSVDIQNSIHTYSGIQYDIEDADTSMTTSTSMTHKKSVSFKTDIDILFIPTRKEMNQKYNSSASAEIYISRNVSFSKIVTVFPISTKDDHQYIRDDLWYSI